MADLKCSVCDLCDRQFTGVEYRKGVPYWYNRHLANHINLVHRGRPPYQCDMCDKEYRTRVFMIDHIKNDHQHRSLFQCDHCGDKVKHKIVLMRHIKKQHGLNGNRLPKRQFDCKRCHQKFGTHYFAYRAHLVTAHGRENFVCDFCSKESLFKLDVAKHIHTVHQNERLFECSYCPAKFRSLRNLDTHTDSKHKGKLLQCDYCGKHHNQRGNLITHILAVHMRKSGFPCTLCKATFPYPQSLYTHKERLHKPKALQCDLCHKMINERQKLIDHLTRTHMSVSRPSWRCMKCGVSFDSSAQLNDHDKRVHLQLKPFTCDACSCRFADRNSIAYHCSNAVHGRAPYKLSPCSNSLKSCFMH